MKILIITLSFLVQMLTTSANDKPKLRLEVTYTNDTELKQCFRLETDTTLKENFEIVYKKGFDPYCIVTIKENGLIIGTFYGIPNPNFIMEIKNRELNDDRINYIIKHSVAQR